MSNELITLTTGALSPADVMCQRKLLVEHMKESMVEGTHYGLIPGCGDKPSLLKPGAEYLLFIFNLGCQFAHVKEYNFAGREGHLNVEATCTLIHRPTGAVISQGSGICSTMESKYRFRTSFTGRPVPPEFWDTRDNSVLGGNQYSARKIKAEDGSSSWQIIESVEHTNPADYYNTVIKMADKRAIVAAVLFGTAASDCFTQDVEDAPELYRRQPAEGGEAKQTTQATQATPRGGVKSTGKVRPASDAQIKLIDFEMEKAPIDKGWLAACLETVAGTTDLNVMTASKLIEALKGRDGRLKQFVNSPYAASDERTDSIDEMAGDFAEIF